MKKTVKKDAPVKKPVANKVAAKKGTVTPASEEHPKPPPPHS